MSANDGSSSRRPARERVDVRFRVAFQGARLSGEGEVANISESGALILHASRCPATGSRIRLRFSFFEDSLPVEVPATVVRETPDGFAVRFSRLEPRLRSVLVVALNRAKKRLRELAQASEGDDDSDITLRSLID